MVKCTLINLSFYLYPKSITPLIVKIYWKILASSIKISFMYYFITNIHGGSGLALLTWKKVKKILIEQNVPYKLLLSERKVHAKELAAAVCKNEDPDKRIVVVGGDGTINEVLNGIGEENFGKVKFGVIPTGSGNDFCRGAGIKRSSRYTKEVLQKILEGSERKIDIGKVTFRPVFEKLPYDEIEKKRRQKKEESLKNTEGKEEGAEEKVASFLNDPFLSVRYFGISSGVGLDAIVCRRVDASPLKKVLNFLRLGGVVYIILTLFTLMTMKFYRVKSRMFSKSAEGFKDLPFGKLIFLAAMNFSAEGGGVKMAPKAAASDGKLWLCAAHGIPRLFSYFIFPFLILGAHSKIKGFTVKSFNGLELESDQSMTLHTDGEYAGEVHSVRWEVLPSCLTLLD
ncbi:MAG: hypothetical protein K6E78_00180 [Treponema sp.]|nr:hypothetical protein [Treponema sp.]